MRFLLALHPQGVRRQTFTPFRVLALRAVRGCCRLVGFTTTAYPLRVVLALVLLAAAAGTACADTLRGVVIVVIDGDTVLFKPDHYSPASRAFLKVRLADIDAPEKDQPHGDAALLALQELVLKRQVELEAVATDVYGRMIARVQAGTVAVDAELVRRGYAWSSSRDPNHAMRTLQREAQEAQRGLWQDPDPTPPWVWRRTHARSAADAFSR